LFGVEEETKKMIITTIKIIIIAVVFALFVMLIQYSYLGPCGSPHGEKVPTGYVGFDNQGQMYASGEPITTSIIVIESLNGTMAIPGTGFSQLQYNLAAEEAKILGPGFGCYLVTHYRVNEYSVDGNTAGGVHIRGWIYPLPQGVDPLHVSFHHGEANMIVPRDGRGWCP
jgi:hypothetical protein